MLPGLNPTHTRKSYYSASSPQVNGSRLPIERIVSTPNDFVTSKDDLWLLPPEVAEQDTEQNISRADWLAGMLERHGNSKLHALKFQRISRLLGRSVIDQNGCLTRGLRGKQLPSSTVIEIAEFEMGTGSHNYPEEVPHVSLCGNDDCYNSRHHNLDFGGSRHDLQRVELNPHWYNVTADGVVETIWGHTLSSIDESLKAFIDFQRSQFPFVPYADSWLTPTPISQLAFHPLTGCWESYMYEKNTAGLVNIKNGYGVMYARLEPEQVNPDTGEIQPGYRRGSVLAHNLIWKATGHDLTVGMERNHLCNYTRCCNPLHIEEISPDENQQHGRAARSYIRALEADNPDVKGAMLSKAKLAELYIPLRERYAEITEQITSTT